MKNWTDPISHPYGKVLDITDRDIYVMGQKRKSRIVNLYDNKVEEKQTWQSPEQRIQQAIEDFLQLYIVKRRVLIVRDMNAYGLV